MQDFVKSWKLASDEMERMRNERLLKMDASAGARMMGAVDASSREDIYANGLARWQAWMIRWRVQELTKQICETSTHKERPSQDA